MRKTQSAIRRARLSVSPPLNQTDIAALLGRTQGWLSLIERGKLRISPKSEQAIFVAISRLRQFRQSKRKQAERVIAEREAELCQDLRLSAV